MNDTEELVKAALAKGAGRAPHPGQIINALNAPRRRSRSIVLAIVGAVVVVAAIAVPVVFRTATAPVPPATEYTPPPPAAAIPMKYKVTYVPADYVERIRQVDIDSGMQTRGWGTAKNWTMHLSVHTPLSPRWSAITREGVEPVEIGGKPGWVSGSGDLTNVTFKPDNETAIQVQVYGPPDSRDVALRVARSVQPDGVTVVRPPLSFGGRLPTRFNRIAVSLRGSSPGTGEAWLTASVDGAQIPAVEARLVPKGTTKLDGWNVVVPRTDGRELELKYNADSRLSELEAQEIAEAVKVEQEPDFSWLGE